MEGEIKNQNSWVYVEGQLWKVVIDQFYNQKYRKFLYYCWLQSFIVCRYNLHSHKQRKFQPIQRNRNLLYTPTTCTKTINQNLIWDDFEQSYTLIIYS